MNNKATLTLLALCLSLGYLSSQTISGIPLHDIEQEYIEVQIIKANFKRTFTAFVDFGQESKSRTRKDTYLSNENGDRMSFNSRMDAFNFFKTNGYEYVDSYVKVYEDDSMIFYLLKKKNNDLKTE